MQRYQEFVTFWHQVKEQGIWGAYEQTLDAAVENTENTARQWKVRRSRLTKRRDHGDMIRRLWQLTQLAF